VTRIVLVRTADSQHEYRIENTRSDNEARQEALRLHYKLHGTLAWVQSCSR
jgi:hypothetical protein